MSREPIGKPFWLLILLIVLLSGVLVVMLWVTGERIVYQSLPDPLLLRIERLANCESNNSKVINYDDGGHDSHYWLQFQKPTWKWANKRYGMNLDIGNYNHQRIIAYKMLEEERYEHWKICSKKLGYL